VELAARLVSAAAFSLTKKKAAKKVGAFVPTFGKMY
jgi:hypothetical protein